MIKNRFIISLVFLSLVHYSFAQLYNNGGSITISEGASLYVGSDILNNSGTLSLEGAANLELTGDLTNSATMLVGEASTLIFSGSADSYLTSGTAVFGNIDLAKTAANLILSDACGFDGIFSFINDNNKAILGDQNLTIGTAASISSFDANEYFQADGLGYLTIKVSTVGSLTFPVGDASSYSPLQVDGTAGTTGTDASVGVRVVDDLHPALYADADAYISRYWEVEVNEISGFEASMTGTYADADIIGDETKINGASYLTDWDFTGSGGDDATNTVSADVSVTSFDLTGMNFYGRMSGLKAFLQGAYSGTGMTTNLTSLPLGPNDGSHFPNISPYGTGETITSIPTDATDWIKIELLDETDPSIIKSSYSKFIRNDGQIIESDGTTNLLFKDAPNSTYIAIHHRNHIDTRTNAPLNMQGSESFDFSDGSNQSNVFNEGWSNDPQIDLGSNVFGLWSGNIYYNSNVRWNGPANDRLYLLNTILSGDKSTIITNVYSDGDLNFNKIVRWNGPANDRLMLLNEVLLGDKSTIIQEHK
jgi:hypothetical protein